jgi:hypothetical protein
MIIQYVEMKRTVDPAQAIPITVAPLERTAPRQNVLIPRELGLPFDPIISTATPTIRQVPI